MTEDGVPGPPTGRLAADELDVSLRPRLGSGWCVGLGSPPTSSASWPWGLLPQPSLSDLVVTRRRDGAELSRTPAGDVGEAGRLLLHVRDLTQQQSVEQLLAVWGPARAATPRPSGGTS